MRRIAAFFVAAALLLGARFYAHAEEPAQPSDWAAAELAEAAALRFVPAELWETPRRPITRAEFACLAVSFLALQYNYSESALLLRLDRIGAREDWRYAFSTNTVRREFRTRFREGEAPLGAFYAEPRVWIGIDDPENPPYDRPAFRDVPDDLAGDTVAWAWALGIIDGRGEETFDPHGAITRQEAAAMLQRAYAVYAGEVSPPAEAAAFSDADEIAPWARDAVAAVYTLDVMRGVDGGRFDPLGSYTCEQSVITFLRLYQNAPVSRARGNVIPLLGYEEEISFISSTGASEGHSLAIFGVSETYEGPLATVLYGSYGGVMHGGDGFFVVYRTGGTGRHWTEDAPRMGNVSGYHDFSFVEEGAILTYTLGYSGYEGWSAHPFSVQYALNLATGQISDLDRISASARDGWAEAEALRFVDDGLMARRGEPLLYDDLARLTLGFLALQYNYDDYALALRLEHGFRPGGQRAEPGASELPWACALGLLDGFDPDAPVTRQELAVTLARAYLLYSGTEYPTLWVVYEDDGDIAQWAKQAVDFLAISGILPETEDNHFHPARVSTVEEAIVLFARLYSDMPVSRAKGTLTPLLTYEEELAFLGETRPPDGHFNWSETYEGPLATVLYGWIGGVMHGNDTFYLVYRTGGTGRLWYHYNRWAWQESRKDFSFSEDGETLFFTIEYGGGITVHFAANLTTGEVIEAAVETAEES